MMLRFTTVSICWALLDLQYPLNAWITEMLSYEVLDKQGLLGSFLKAKSFKGAYTFALLSL